ncbi:hypothetical protein ABE099_05325 [Paenibacillus turicensis]|uniref:hypothetical protein n=1 Tax=Paenibacillus turicensis TaxID=160487 RepID=UPI003D2899F4
MKKRYIVLIVMLIVGLWLGSWYFIPRWYGKEVLEAGTFGDMFGAVNALFSGLAFAGLIITIVLQRRDLDLQRKAIDMQTEELRMQREETARSANELENQRKLMNFQIVLNTLNGMLSAKKEAYRSVSIRESQVEFHDIVINIKHEIWLEKKRHLFNDYLSVFFGIIQYIYQSKIDEGQKKELIEIVLINTTSLEYEVIMIFSKSHQQRKHLLEYFKFGEKIKAREYSRNGM